MPRKTDTELTITVPSFIMKDLRKAAKRTGEPEEAILVELMHDECYLLALMDYGKPVSW